MKKISVLLASVVLLLTGCFGENAGSFGVIGGADGPTAIFTAQGAGWPTVVLIMVALVVVVLAVFWLVNRKK